MPAELKVELITMIEQSGSHKPTGSFQRNFARESVSTGSPSTQDMQPGEGKGSSIDHVSQVEDAGLLITATGATQPIEIGQSRPNRCALEKGAEAATTITEESEDTSTVEDTALSALKTTRNQFEDVHALPPLPLSSDSEAAPSFDCSAASTLLIRPRDEGQTTLMTSKLRATCPFQILPIYAVR